jgi:hypothetical protein
VLQAHRHTLTHSPLPVPPRNWGWPNQINFFSTADPQFGLGNGALAGDAGVYTGNQSKRSATQPAQAIIGQASIFDYLENASGHLFREGNVVPEAIDAEFVPGISLVTVDISADGMDVSHNQAFDGAELLPTSSLPASAIWNSRSGAYVGTVQQVFAHNRVQPGGWPNLNTGGFRCDDASDPGKCARAPSSSPARP